MRYNMRRAQRRSPLSFVPYSLNETQYQHAILGSGGQGGNF